MRSHKARNDKSIIAIRCQASLRLQIFAYRQPHGVPSMLERKQSGASRSASHPPNARIRGRANAIAELRHVMLKVPKADDLML